MGIDIENMNSDHFDVLETQITEQEKKLLKKVDLSPESGNTILWTVKEALSKILKTGLMTPMEIYEVENIDKCAGYVSGVFRNFPQYKFISLIYNDYVSSIVYPMGSVLEVELFLKSLHCFDKRSEIR